MTVPPLAGLRVIDAASFIAGPVATTILADLGADVVKIEPPDGDTYRHRGGGPGVPESPYNYRWIVDNRTKRGLALDLRKTEGCEVLCRLVERADVFVTNTPLDSRARTRFPASMSRTPVRPEIGARMLVYSSSNAAASIFAWSACRPPSNCRTSARWVSTVCCVANWPSFTARSRSSFALANCASSFAFMP